MTTDGPSPGAPCVFPFIFGDKTFNECITVSDPDQLPWCSIKVLSFINFTRFWNLIYYLVIRSTKVESMLEVVGFGATALQNARVRPLAI